MADLKPSPKRGTLEFFARQTPDRIAIVDGPQRLSWREWDQQANRLAAALEEAVGLTFGDRVAVRIHNRHEWFVINAALAKLGAIFVSIGWRLTPAEVRYFLEDSGSRAFVFDDDPRTLADAWAEPAGTPRAIVPISLEPTDVDGVLAYRDLVASGSDEERMSAGQATSVLYTSGTTSQPRGVLRGSEEDAAKRSARSRLVRDLSQSLGIGPEDRHLVCAPLYHGAAPTLARLTLWMGGVVHIMHAFDAERTLRVIADEEITSTFMVPTMLNRIVDLPESVRRSYDVSSVRMILTGASPVPFDLKRRVIDYFGPHCLYESYGASEIGLATLLPPEEQLWRPGSCGRLLEGVAVRILDERGAELPRGEVGDIYVSSPEVIDRYLTKDPQGADVSKDGYFDTGDVGRLDEDGFLYIVDRKKDLIISGGVNIYPAEVEAVLRQHPAILDVAVFGVPNDDLGEEVKAVCEVVPDSSVTAEELLAFSRSKLGGYKCPRSIDFTDELPRSPVGKLLKRQLREPYWAATGRDI